MFTLPFLNHPRNPNIHSLSLQYCACLSDWPPLAIYIQATAIELPAHRKWFGEVVEEAKSELYTIPFLFSGLFQLLKLYLDGFGQSIPTIGKESGSESGQGQSK